MNKRGYSLAQSVLLMVVLSFILLSLATLTSEIKSQQSTNTERQMLVLLNVNKLEELNHELNSTGKLQLGTQTLEVYYNMKPCKMDVSISGSEGSDVYYVKLSSRFNGLKRQSVTSEALLALEANFSE